MNSSAAGELFDRKWHKLEVKVARSGVEVYVDCQLIASRSRKSPLSNYISPTGNIAIVNRLPRGKNPSVFALLLFSDKGKCYHGRCTFEDKTE